jgi:acyl dehydratase
MSVGAGDPPVHSDVSYDDLEVGRRYGPFSERVDAELSDNVREEIGSPSTGMLASPAVYPILFLKALRRAMGGIPPGSILGKQELEFHAPLKVGEEASIETWVGDKYVRRDRPYAVIDFDIRGSDGRQALTGRKIIVWPAIAKEE